MLILLADFDLAVAFLLKYHFVLVIIYSQVYIYLDTDTNLIFFTCLLKHISIIVTVGQKSI